MNDKEATSIYDFLTNVLNKFFDFTSENFISILILVFIILQREAISNFIKRLTNLTFQKGNSSLGLGAASPQPEIEHHLDTGNPIKAPVKMEQDIISEESELQDENYISNMSNAFHEGRIEDAKKEFEKYQNKEDDINKRNSNKAMYLYFLFKEGKDNTAITQLENLVDLAEDEATKHQVIRWLSLCFTESSQVEAVIKLWEKAISSYKDDILITKATFNLAKALDSNERSDEAKDILITRLNNISSDEEKSIIYDALSDIEKSLGHNKLAVYCKDKLLEFDPLNRDELFNTAYFGSNEDVKVITLSNYTTLLHIDPNHSTALNNLGVLADTLKVNIKAVEHYKKSSEKNNTLAMSNQGNLLLDAGFTEEAEKLAQKALQIDDPHPNVYKLLSRIDKEKKEEDKKWNKIISNAEKKQKYLREYVTAYYIDTSNKFDVDWKLSNGDMVVVKVNGNQLEMKWKEKEANNTYNITITGTITNSSFSGKYKKTIDGDVQNNSLLLLSSNKEANCFGIMTNDGSSLKIISSDYDQDLLILLKR